jgi:hypothetical protein
MQLIEVISLASFEDTRIGSVTRKQRLRISADLANYLHGIGLIKYVNPPQAVVIESPKTEATDLGGDAPQSLSQPEPASPSETVKVSRRGRRKKTGEY